MTDQAQDKPTLPPPPAKKAKPAPKPTFRDRLAVFLFMVAELILPVAIAGVGMYFLFNHFNLLAGEESWTKTLYGVVVTLIALGLSILGDRVLAPLRRRYYKRGARLGKTSNARMIKMAFAGLIIPIGLIVAANMVMLPAQLFSQSMTGMQYLSNLSSASVSSAPPNEVGQLVLQAEDPATKVLGIQVLQGLKTPEALDQLMKIAENDRSALKDGGVSQALQTAIASYGTDAIDPLTRLFKNLPAEQASGVAPTSDLFERYFSGAFQGLQAEITRSVPDGKLRQEQLDQLAAAQTQLEQNLAGVQAGLTVDDDPRQDFVLRTLLAINLKKSSDLLHFAKTTAADATRSGLVRGDALLLWARFGDEKDLAGLYSYLGNSDPVLQNHALQAILELQKKVGQAPPKDQGTN